jgi:hypothetical protein
MAKTKLKIEHNQLQRLKECAEVVDIKVLNEKDLGHEVIVQVSFKQPSQLVDLGRLIEKDIKLSPKKTK